MPSTPPNGMHHVPATEPNGHRNHEQDHVEPDNRADTNDHDVNGDGAQSPSDPSEPLPLYDWDDLGARYEDMIRERQGVEERIEDEFRRLLEVFAVVPCVVVWWE